MKAIFKRELKSYFSSPIGYVCIAALACLYGFFYLQVMMYGSSSYISYFVYQSMLMFNMMIIPIITMRALTEDRKNKTDQALLTAPVNVASIVTGKFLASFMIFAIATTYSLVPAIVIEFIGDPSWGIIFGNYFATLFYGAAMIAIGIFVSSLTESQVIAAIGTFAIAILLLLMGDVAYAFTGTFLGTALEWISFTNRYTSFTQGVFSISNVVFFLSVVAIFIFLTARKIESRRWN